MYNTVVIYNTVEVNLLDSFTRSSKVFVHINYHIICKMMSIIFSTMLNRSNKSRHPDLMRKVFNLSPIKLALAVGFI